MRCFTNWNIVWFGDNPTINSFFTSIGIFWFPIWFEYVSLAHNVRLCFDFIFVRCMVLHVWWTHKTNQHPDISFITLLTLDVGQRILRTRTTFVKQSRMKSSFVDASNRLISIRFIVSKPTQRFLTFYVVLCMEFMILLSKSLSNDVYFI